MHKGRPVAGIINEVFSKDEAAVWGVALEGEDGFKVGTYLNVGCRGSIWGGAACFDPSRVFYFYLFKAL